MSAIHLKINGAVAELLIDNPDKLNALTITMLESLEAHCNSIEKDNCVRVVLLRAEGDRAFCVGADINAWGNLPPFEFARQWVRNGHRAFDRLAQLPQPTIAVISGPAFGGGLELATACDLRIMTPEANLALPETGVGIVPGWSGTQRLCRHLPPAVMNEMLFAGRQLTAERAFDLGFINEVSATPYKAALKMADEITSKSSDAIEVSKYLMRTGMGEGADSAVEAMAGGMMAASDDKTEGVASFREKRKPNF